MPTPTPSPPPDASESRRGVVSTGDQKFVGKKTFLGGLAAAVALTVAGVATFEAAQPDQPAMVVKTASGATANALEVADADGGVVFSVLPDGRLKFKNGSIQEVAAEATMAAPFFTIGTGASADTGIRLQLYGNGHIANSLSIGNLPPTGGSNTGELLSVNGGIKSYNTGFIFPDNTVQLTAVTPALLGGKVTKSGDTMTGALAITSNGQALRLNGTDHSYIGFYPGGSTRSGYMGFAPAGSDNLTLANEVSGPILFDTGGATRLGVYNGFNWLRQSTTIENSLGADVLSIRGPSGGGVKVNWEDSTGASRGWLGYGSVDTKLDLVNSTGDIAISPKVGNQVAVFSNLVTIQAPTSSTATFVELGRDDTASTIDFHSGTGTYPDYGLRLTRSVGGSGYSLLAHAGTGPFVVDAEHGGSISLRTSGTERLGISGAGAVALSGTLTVPQVCFGPGDCMSTVPAGGGGSVTPDTVHLVGTTGEPAFQNGLSNFGSGYQSLGFYKDIGRVCLQGMANVGAGVTVFTLPTGYRPVATVNAISMGGGGSGVARIEIYSNGEVKGGIGGMSANTYNSFDNVCFRAAP